jgi:hypothetical protein
MNRCIIYKILSYFYSKKYYYERNGPNYPVDPYQSSSNDGGYTVYNLRKNAQISPTVPAGFHVCK